MSNKNTPSPSVSKELFLVSIGLILLFTVGIPTAIGASFVAWDLYGSYKLSAMVEHNQHFEDVAYSPNYCKISAFQRRQKASFRLWIEKHSARANSYSTAMSAISAESAAKEMKRSGDSTGASHALSDASIKWMRSVRAYKKSLCIEAELNIRT